MDLWTALGVLARRWRVVVAGAVVTLLGLWGVYLGVAVTYEAEGEIIFILPAQEADDGASDESGLEIGLQNPYLGFGGSLNVMTFVIARAAGGQQAAELLEEAGGTSDFVVDVVPGDAPMLSITTTSIDSDEAMESYAAVHAWVIQELESRQELAGAPEQLRIVASAVRSPITPEPQFGSLLRAAAAVLILGGASTVVLAFLAESVAARRRGSAPGASHGSAHGLDGHKEVLADAEDPDTDRPGPPVVDPPAITSGEGDGPSLVSAAAGAAANDAN